MYKTHNCTYDIILLSGIPRPIEMMVLTLLACPRDSFLCNLRDMSKIRHQRYVWGFLL